jgi:hypothetical protein
MLPPFLTADARRIPTELMHIVLGGNTVENGARNFGPVTGTKEENFLSRSEPGSDLHFALPFDLTVPGDTEYE